MPGKPWLVTHLSPDHRRKIAESLTGHRRSAETRKRMSEVKGGEKNPRWAGDDVGYVGQHHRAGAAFPSPLGPCQVPGCKEDAMDRARIDHTNLPYRPELVLPMCRAHNVQHHRNKFLILFEAKEVET